MQKNATCVIIGLSEGLDKLEMDVLLAHSIGSEILVNLNSFFELGKKAE